MTEFQKLKSDIVFEHTLVADLVYCEGPIISLFESPDGYFYLYCWREMDSSNDRWLIVKLDKTTARHYLLGAISLKDIITKPPEGFLYLIRIDKDNHYDAVYTVDPSHLPDSYIPEAHSFYTASKFSYLTSEDQLGVMAIILSDRTEYANLLKILESAVSGETSLRYEEGYIAHRMNIKSKDLAEPRFERDIGIPQYVATRDTSLLGLKHMKKRRHRHLKAA